jgi:hypothetical protein
MDHTNALGMYRSFRTVATLHCRSYWRLGCLTYCESQCDMAAGAGFSFCTDNGNAGLQTDKPLQQMYYQATGCHPGLWLCNKAMASPSEALAPGHPLLSTTRAIHELHRPSGDCSQSIALRMCHKPLVRFPSRNGANPLNLKLGSK